VRVRRRDLAAVDQVRAAGSRLTAKPLATLETAVAVPDGSEFLDQALQRHVDFAAVYRAYCRNLGAHGGAHLAVLLAAAADRADSAAERLMIAIMRGAALRGWVHGLRFDRWTVDFASPAASWPSRWTGGRGTWTSSGSGPTGTRATRWSGPAGTCCGSPSTT
jgi:hypothetical protein